jgi:hypothetical protein
MKKGEPALSEIRLDTAETGGGLTPFSRKAKRAGVPSRLPRAHHMGQ